jgi:hypothetical protein
MIAPGVEMAKRAEAREQPGGAIKVFGVNMPDGKLAVAHGVLVWVMHSKCYWIGRKHEQRSGAANPLPPAAQAG